MQPHVIEFFKATARGDVPAMVQLLQAGEQNINRLIDTETRDPDGMTPLLVACATGQAQSMDFLLTSHCNANMTIRDKNGHSALFFLGTRILMLRHFLQMLGLKAAARERQRREQRRAAAAGGDGEDRNHQAEDDDEMQKIISAQEAHGLTCLHAAAKNGSYHVVKILLEHGAVKSIDKPCQCPDTPLTACVRNGDSSVAQLLINAGANIEFRAGAEGNTPLSLAILNNDVEMVKLLLGAGCKREGWQCSTAPGCCRSYQHLCEKLNRKELWELILTYTPESDKKNSPAEATRAKGPVSDADRVVAAIKAQFQNVDYPFWAAVFVVLVGWLYLSR